MIVLGVGNRARQGKSLFCATIIERCSFIGISCREYSISEAIIQCCIAEGILPKNAKREACDPNILVRVGNAKRAERKDYWVNEISKAIDIDKPQVALIPNVRFPQEVELVKSLGGYTVRVRRLNPNGTFYISPDRNPNDPCECTLDLAAWDFEIVNMPGREFWLRRQAAALFDYLREGAE